MLKTPSTLIGLALLVMSALFLWLAGSLEYRHAYIPAAFGATLLGLAFYGSQNSRSALLASAALAAVGMAWGVEGAIETSGLLYGPARMLVDAVTETVTVILLSIHLLLTVASSVSKSRRAAVAQVS